MAAALEPILRRHGLTDPQRELVRALAFKGMRIDDAGKVLGFGSGTAYQMLAIPAVSAALHEAVALSIRSDAPVNMQVLRRIRDNEKAPAGVRADIAIKLLRLAGYIEPTKHDTGPERSLSEMTADELRAWREQNQREIDRLEGELAIRAQSVSAPDSAPIDAADEPKPLSYLD